MPENQQPDQKPETGEQPGSLRTYWLEGAASQPKRRTGTSEPGNVYATPLTLSAETPHRTRIGASQPALPLTWYGAEHDEPEGSAGSHSLTQLQRTVEERGVQALSNVDLLTLVVRTAGGKEETVRRIHAL